VCVYVHSFRLQNLAAKEAEWKAGTTQGASVTSAGGDGASLPLVEVNKDTFYPALEAAGDALVVVDFMTDWCGPCKLMAPKLAAWHGELAPAVQFLKFNCNKDNAVLGKALGIKVAPTFHLYRAGKQLAVLTGAKEEALRELIDQHRGKA
jgi:thioredoxin 1